MPNDLPLHKVPVNQFKGVGPRNAERLAKLSIKTAQDLLFHLPLRYQDRTRILPILHLRHGDNVVIEGTITQTDIKHGRRRSLVVHINDQSGVLLLRFFHFGQQQLKVFTLGSRLRCFGEVRRNDMFFEMVHPEYQPLIEGGQLAMDDCLSPIYPTTEGLNQSSWMKLTDQAITLLENAESLQEFMPKHLLEKHQFPSLKEAILYLHRPPPDAPQALIAEGQTSAQHRLAFEELLAHQLSLLQLRQFRRKDLAPAMPISHQLNKQLMAQLSFKLTHAQQKVSAEIQQDMQQTAPMMRLIQGDVGSGKTIVAALAALQAIEAGYQVAMLAPTELLAEQHYHNFKGWLDPMGLNCGWLTSRHKGKKRQQRLVSLQQGETHIMLGTHALFQAEVEYHHLGLVIIDEQHRFGVHQRMALREKGNNGLMPHQLIMTATPIPRTLAMTAYADLELSIIDELPPNRMPITTVVMSDQRRPDIIDRVKIACTQGRQAYWVCTLIEESEALQCQTAEDTAKLLQETLPELNIGLVHGRLKGKQKESMMRAFKLAEIDLLVATTVIEVGVDVPNASLMIIENPERLGLAQLHQLRGRVGRGSIASHCVLMYHPPLSRHGQARLAILRKSNDGFVIAQKDLELRGPGEVLGTRQTGAIDFKIADLLRDQHLINDVQQAAIQVIKEYPDHAQFLVERWIGEKTQFIDA